MTNRRRYQRKGDREGSVSDLRVVAAGSGPPLARPDCPKRMVYGPCGGAHDGGRCELAEYRCAFAELTEPLAFRGLDEVATDDRPGRPGLRSQLVELAARRPVVLSDLTVRPFDEASLRAITATMSGSCDAVLVGEHQNRPDFPPVLMARLLADAGSRAWVTLACRDRNRLILEQEVAGLLRTDVDGVLCVTGDARAQGVRPGVTQVFDLDGTRLAAIAASAGLPVAVAESPEAYPRRIRPGRLVQKQLAGASLAVLNHVSDLAGLGTFLSEARALGLTIPVVAGVAVFTDARSAAVLQNFPGLSLDPDRVQAVLDAADPVQAGIDSAVAEARAVLALDGVSGINVSGLASGAGVEFAAEVKAAVGRAVMAGLK